MGKTNKRLITVKHRQDETYIRMTKEEYENYYKYDDRFVPAAKKGLKRLITLARYNNLYVKIQKDGKQRPIPTESKSVNRES